MVLTNPSKQKTLDFLKTDISIFCIVLGHIHHIVLEAPVKLLLSNENMKMKKEKEN